MQVLSLYSSVFSYMHSSSILPWPLGGPSAFSLSLSIVLLTWEARFGASLSRHIMLYACMS